MRTPVVIARSTGVREDRPGEKVTTFLMSAGGPMVKVEEVSAEGDTFDYVIVGGGDALSDGERKAFVDEARHQAQTTYAQ